MATKVPLPKFHNITSEKFKRTLERPCDFDPFAQPDEPQGPWWNRVLYWMAGIMLVSMAIAMIFALEVA